MLVLVSVSMVLDITRANRVRPNYPLVAVIASASDLTLSMNFMIYSTSKNKVPPFGILLSYPLRRRCAG